MRRAFEDRGQKIGNVHSLWHGTGVANILNILKEGFQINPPQTAQITGKMFSNGLYFAPSSTKALNYGFGYWNGTRNKSCFLFLCDVAVGKYQIPKAATSKSPAKGFDSYWAQPSKTAGIINDETVVFNAAQIDPRFLLEFAPS